MSAIQSFELAVAPGKGDDVENGQVQFSTRDEADMAQLGRNQVLKRHWSFTSVLGLNCSIVGTWIGVSVLFITGLQNGGPAGIIWSYLIVWAGTTCAFVPMAELASMIPSSGGMYHWAYILSPPGSRKYISYLVGWLTVLGWQATVTAFAFQASSLVGGLIAEVWPLYVSFSWHEWLFLWAVLLIAILANTVIGIQLPRIEVMILVAYIVCFFAIVIPMVAMSSHESASNVFTTFLNRGGWSSQGLSFWVGMVGNVFAFIGPDGAVHMSEEIHNASTNVPHCLLISITLNGLLGFGMLIALLCSATDLGAALDAPSGFPFLEIFRQATGSTSGTITVLVIFIILIICATISGLAASSRMIWSLARDRGLPGWQILSEVDPRTSVPDVSIAFSTAVACAIGLINIGSTVVFNNIVSFSVNALYLPYIVCAVLLLWRRCTDSNGGGGGIAEPRTDPLDKNTRPKVEFQRVWGPWRVRGWLGVAINVLGLVFLCLACFFSFWPAVTPVDAASMNYSIAVLVFVVAATTLYYLVKANKVYSGPVVERGA